MSIKGLFLEHLSKMSKAGGLSFGMLILLGRLHTMHTMHTLIVGNFGAVVISS